MSWARLDDAILDNPKIIAAGPLGFALHVAAITWCCRNLTDGLIPKRRVASLLDLPSLQVSETTKVRVLHALTPDDLAADLVRLGLWHDRGGAYELHDFLEYNFSRAQVLARREHTRKRVNKHRELACNAVTNAAVTHLPVPVPVPLEEKISLREIQKKSRATRAQRAISWPDTLTLSPDRMAVKNASRAEWEAFRDHHQAKGSRFVDWDAAWRTWCRRAQQFTRTAARRPEPTGGALPPTYNVTQARLQAEAEALRRRREEG